MGWLGAIIAGGLAGFIAEKIMKFDIGLMMNIILGIAGAIVMNFIMNMLGVEILSEGFISYIIKGTVGACLLIYLYRVYKGSKSKSDEI